MDPGAVEACHDCNIRESISTMGAIPYAALATKTANLIELNGRNVTIRKQAKGTPLDSNKPWRGDSGSATEETVKAVVSPFTSEEINASTILLGDKKVLVAANAVTAGERPLIRDFDEVVDGAETWHIVDMKIVEPGGVQILFTFHVRKLGT